MNYIVEIMRNRRVWRQVGEFKTIAEARALIKKMKMYRDSPWDWRICKVEYTIVDMGWEK